MRESGRPRSPMDKRVQCPSTPKNSNRRSDQECTAEFRVVMRGFTTRTARPGKLSTRDGRGVWAPGMVRGIFVVDGDSHLRCATSVRSNTVRTTPLFGADRATDGVVEEVRGAAPGCPELSEQAPRTLSKTADVRPIDRCRRRF